MSKEIDLSEYEGLGDLISELITADKAWRNSMLWKAGNEDNQIYIDSEQRNLDYVMAVINKLNEFGNGIRKEINFDEQRSLITSMNKNQLDELIKEAKRAKDKLVNPAYAINWYIAIGKDDQEAEGKKIFKYSSDLLFSKEDFFIYKEWGKYLRNGWCTSLRKGNGYLLHIYGNSMDDLKVRIVPKEEFPSE